jgi:hypothetical protein
MYIYIYMCVCVCVYVCVCVCVCVCARVYVRAISSRGSVVGSATRLLAGQSTVRIPIGVHFFLPSYETNSLFVWRNHSRI